MTAVWSGSDGVVQLNAPPLPIMWYHTMWLFGVGHNEAQFENMDGDHPC
jgi:hypothetical protein